MRTSSSFNETHAAEEMPYFGQEILIEAEAEGLLTEAAHRTARDEAVRLSPRGGP